jgi:hypothetical protein
MYDLNMYERYIKYVKSIKEIKSSDFKSHEDYTYIIESLSYDSGLQYLSFIKIMHPEIDCNLILNYIKLNDKYGKPKKHEYFFNSETSFEASPTSLRYILHALDILKYYKTKNLKNIVEIGCGYGGLFLAINIFAKELNIQIDNYFLIDLEDNNKLINMYLMEHSGVIDINYITKKACNYGIDIDSNELFLISNYCFTEIDPVSRNKYVEYLFNKVHSGYILWQTSFGVTKDDTYILNKNIISITQELPQTSHENWKNYIVLF